jgi:hypothetical protein
VLIWSLDFKIRPEFYCLLSHNRVCSATFNPFNDSIVFGGLASGRVVMWDVRASRNPVQKSKLNN